MKHAKLAIAIMVIASLAAPTVHAKSKHRAASQASPTSQAGGLPETNARVAALEAAVVSLQAGLAAETAARQAADAALSNQLATIPLVYLTDGAVNDIKAATVTVASKIVPAGTYFILASVQMVNGQSTGDANARCVMRANGNLLADTSDLQFPILTTASGTTSNAFGSTMFAPLQSSYSSTSPITIAVECTESKGQNGGLDAFVQLAAMKMGSVQ